MSSTKVAIGSLMMVGKRLAVRVLSLASTFVLARLLAPADFGLLALVMGFAAILDAMTAFKFDRVLVRSEGVDADHYHTAWTITFIGNTLIALVLVGLTPWITALAKTDAAQVVLVAVALCFVIDGVYNMGMVEWRRKLDFSKEFRLEFIRKLTEVGVSITWAVVSPTVWALVAGMFAGRLVGLVLSFVLHPMRPRFTLVYWRSMLSFSSMTIAISLAARMVNSIDNILISRLYSLEAVGLYSNAQMAASLPTAEMVRPISVALYAGFANILTDIPRLRDAYFNALHGILTLALPAAVGLSFVADAAVRLLLGSKWMGCADLLQSLALVQIVTLSGATSFSILVALDRMKMLVVRAWLMLCVRPLLVYVALKYYGFYALPYAIFLVMALQVSLDSWSVRRALEFSVRTWVSRTWRPYCATAVMAAALWLLLPARDVHSLSDAFVKLTQALAIAVPVYALAALALWRLVGKPAGIERMILSWLGGKLGRRAGS